MYALIQNNQIKVGPRQFHKGFFDRFLEESNLPELSQKVPYTYDQRDTIILNETTEIRYVEEPTIPAYNQLTEQLAGPFFDTTKTPVTGHYDVADRSIDAAKNDLKAQVADLRYQKETSGTKVTLQGQEVSVDTGRGADRDIWFQAFMLLPEGTVQKFKFPKENVWLELSKTEIGTIVQTIMTHVQSSFEWEANKVAEIDAANDKATIEAIVVKE